MFNPPKRPAGSDASPHVDAERKSQSGTVSRLATSIVNSVTQGSASRARPEAGARTPAPATTIWAAVTRSVRNLASEERVDEAKAADTDEVGGVDDVDGDDGDDDGDAGVDLSPAHVAHLKFKPLAVVQKQPTATQHARQAQPHHAGKAKEQQSQVKGVGAASGASARGSAGGAGKASGAAASAKPASRASGGAAPRGSARPAKTATVGAVKAVKAPSSASTARGARSAKRIGGAITAVGPVEAASPVHGLRRHGPAKHGAAMRMVAWGLALSVVTVVIALLVGVLMPSHSSDDDENQRCNDKTQSCGK